MSAQLSPIEAHERTVGQVFSDAYSPQWEEFLSEGQNSFLVLGCMDRDFAYALPVERVTKILDDLNRTPDRHWHIVLEENETSGLDLSLPKTGSRIGLSNFEFKLDGRT